MEITDEQRKAIEEQKEQCPFCKIIKGEIPSKKVFEDDQLLGILDINPATKGHILLMPKEHYPIMPLIPQDVFLHLASVIKKLVGCMRTALLTDGASIYVANGAAAGQQSAHFMLHIVPREAGDNLSCFDIVDKKISATEIQKIIDPLRNNLAVMMKNHLQRMGKEVPVGKEQVLQLLEANPQVKEMLLKDPEGFKKAIPSNPQLKSLFKDVDIDEIIKELGGKVEQQKQEPEVQEQKEEEKLLEQKEDSMQKEEPSAAKEKKSVEKEDEGEKKDIITALKDIISKNPDLKGQIEKEPEKVIEMLKKSKYKEETEGVTVEDLKKAIKDDEDKGTNLDDITNMLAK